MLCGTAKTKLIFLLLVEWWNRGTVEWWNGGMVEWWNRGMVSFPTSAG
jgi:hypothetical protein